MICNDAWKYSPNARKFEAKADKQFERLNVIAIVQVKTESRAVKHAARFNLQRRIHVKPRLKQRSLKQNTLNFARIFCAAIKNFLAFTAYFFALLQTCQHKLKPTLILSVRVAIAGKQSSP